DHTNIIRFIDFHPPSNPTDHTPAYIINEHFSAPDLYTTLSSTPPPPTFAAFKTGWETCAFSKLIEAVEYLHSNHVAHRDLKPENILFHPETQAFKLIDFGSAAFIPSNPSTTTANPDDLWMTIPKLEFGSGPYIPPELFVATPSEQQRRTA
ncbi:hypothetical protein HDV05_007665, partial [Chytridiales sp. JEL 0842]